MNFTYGALLDPDPDGGFLVTFPEVPEALTHGDDRDEALRQARDALGMALLGYLKEGRALPEPGIGQTGRNRATVAPLAEQAAKLAVMVSFAEAGISKSELARRMGKGETEARRLLDPDHASKLPALEAALDALGHRMVIAVEPA